MLLTGPGKVSVPILFVHCLLLTLCYLFVYYCGSFRYAKPWQFLQNGLTIASTLPVSSVCMAFYTSLKLYGMKVNNKNGEWGIAGGLELLDGPEPEKILVGPRVGIQYALPHDVNALWRFAIADSPWISAPKKTLAFPSL